MPASSMTASAVPHYVYDSHETAEHFRARQRLAYAAGRCAWRERLIKAQLLPFYEALVGYVGQNQYAWVKEQTLADEFAVHVATIKRWLSKLEDAGLIRRQRRFATSSLTYITAYDAGNAGINDTDNLYEKHQDKKDYRQTGVPSVGRKNALTLGAKTRPDSIKDDQLNDGGGSVPAVEEPEHVTHELLHQEGLSDYYLVPVIQQKSPAELQAISSYLDQQRNVRDRQRLFAWLASRDFGAQLLRGGSEPASSRPASKQRTHRRAQPREAGQARSMRSSRRDAGHCPTTPARAGAEDLAQIWQQVIAQLQPVLPPDAFATWLTDTTLLALDDRAVVGTPHVFARDVLQSEYAPVLAQAAQAVLQRSVEVVVVVDHAPAGPMAGSNTTYAHRRR